MKRPTASLPDRSEGTQPAKPGPSSLALVSKAVELAFYLRTLSLSPFRSPFICDTVSKSVQVCRFLTGTLRSRQTRRLSLLPARDLKPRGRRKGSAMRAEPEPERPPDGGSSMYVSISNSIVGLLREYTGRGPTKARTTLRDNLVVVLLEQTLTKGEQVLVEKGRGENVLALRHEYQEAMRDEASARVAEITGRKVLAMMSANHLDPDLGVELFVLDGPPENHVLAPAPEG
jgi:uncharacterized protein YbcI